MVVPVLPESAPFSPAQRAWLNGFFAGAFGVAPNGATQPALAAAPAPVAEEDFPWHDPALPMEDRLKLADGKALDRRLMASMAQLDCGACGYVCKTYSEALASGQEKDLTKCSPGGKDTAKKLKELLAANKELAVAVNGHPANSNGAAKSNDVHAKFDRHNPAPAPLIQCRRLTNEASEKDVRFVNINLKGSGLDYEVGDALGVFPENCPDLVESILKELNARGDELVTAPDGRQVLSYDALTREYSITKMNDAITSLLADYATDSAEASDLRALVDNDQAGVLEWWDLLDVLMQFPTARPPIAELIAALAPLQSRLYSISSSLKAHPGEVHLTVGVVRYTKNNRLRKGVASSFLTERIRPRQKLRVFVQTSHGFRVPANPDTPMIMVGPGTGIAPFRAFLEERHATGARGKNWLFFGDQRQEYDFLYRDELQRLVSAGVLSRLDTAFSRDQEEKIYVQHRLMENSREIWAWLQEGAHFYVCGDARRMALDVDRALNVIVAAQGNMCPEDAKEYVKNLSKAKRYQRDVY